MADKTYPLHVIPTLYSRANLRPNRSCLNCKWLNRKDMASCVAYPNGIPYPILSGEVAHDRPLPGDNGIMWNPAPDAETGLPAGINPEDLP
jgi:hypothetical protein